ncbi:hypothetical protein [Nocardia brasiliensis]|uniref:hypothetical protein n=1 Tax=Nocardia brasiliensis TaxID=37326 RepID=UPI0024565E66|nr:hypothetical protein [Nocardia brasiliensis]
MAMFVHLTPEKNVRRIRRAGIKVQGAGVFCVPVLPSYVLSHQWLRELRRHGQRGDRYLRVISTSGGRG